MTGISDLASLLVATLIFLAIPGPGTIKLLASVAEVRGGIRAGFWATLGLMSGDIVWMVLALSGVAALAAAYPGVFTALRYVGAAYLAWIGIGLIRDARSSAMPAEAHALQAGTRGALQWWREACWVTLSNPKAIGFYVAFFPLFIDPKTFDGFSTYLRMAAVVLGLTFSYCMFLVTVATLAKRLFHRYTALGMWLKRVAGVALIGFSIKFVTPKA